MFRLFQSSESKPQGSKDTVPRALPASWYHSQPLYDLERRAIFSRKWLLVTHKSRFAKPGDFLRYEEAGFPFFLCLDRNGTLRGFHNVCRHRAFPIITSESGSASILGCKYHGWSYGLNGKLAKAPRFEDVANFDKEQNGLFPVHVHLDQRGFVWVNLDGDESPSVPWTEDFLGADTQERLGDFNMDDYGFDHTWSMHGDYNWKTLVDNYNECYHCSVAHPGIAAISDLTSYKVETVGGQIQHFVKDKPGHESDMKVAPTFLFPNASVTMTSHYFYLMRVVPTSATTTSMQYEVFRHKDASDETFKELDDFFKQVEGEDKELCNGAQRNLNAGVYVNGNLQPVNEKGVLYFQSLVKRNLFDHRQREEQAAGEIWPSMKNVMKDTSLNDEIQFCSGLQCSDYAKSRSELAW
ncbi:aromatic ring-hydroxylating oxygenase subunit alpha [Aspergillus stella-maris]|uniref:aromatic ring-hydroxylating oxygenase subunit alpha n=1 Tax=Aspergillus stella-maris TaxID=1810926 RepID=UPI003CCD033C